MMGDAFEDRATYTAAQPEATYISELLADDRFIAIAAFEDSTVVGGLAAYVLPKFEQARREMYLYDLAVAAPFRRKGVASALITALRDEAAACGAYVIFVQADPPDAPAVALYERFGTREDVYHFDIPVND